MKLLAADQLCSAGGYLSPLLVSRCRLAALAAGIPFLCLQADQGPMASPIPISYQSHTSLNPSLKPNLKLHSYCDCHVTRGAYFWQ